MRTRGLIFCPKALYPRPAIVEGLTYELGAHFYLDRAQFEQGQFDFLRKALDVKSIGTKHYYRTYTDPFAPPVWVLLEGLTFGPLSRLRTHNQKMTVAAMQIALMKVWAQRS
ncbi:protein of unknown function [Magnetospira sp. QH-2]|nr:protein of unknown function [Magnetospira sp. QH-2]